MNLLKKMFGAGEETPMATIKGIYIMSCSPGPADRGRHTQLISRALQDLNKGNRRFQRCHAQALRDKPTLYEGIQQMAAVPIGFSNEELVEGLLPKFKQWMQQKYGVGLVEEKRKDQFFSKVIVSDTVHGVLVYYRT